MVELVGHIPDEIQRLPKDPRGFPIPWFVAVLPDGSRDLRLACANKRYRSFKDSLCWVCGTPLKRVRVFIGGPFSTMNRIFADSWMHPACALFSVQNCPFINGKMVKRPDKPIPEECETGVAPGFIPDRPEYTATYKVLGPAGTVLIEKGRLIKAAPSISVKWWKDGQEASGPALEKYLADKRKELEAALRGYVHA